LFAGLSFLAIEGLIIYESYLVVAMQAQSLCSAASTIDHTSIMAAALFSHRSILESFFFKCVGRILVNRYTCIQEV
jgi:hypothetical protein